MRTAERSPVVRVLDGRDDGTPLRARARAWTAAARAPHVSRSYCEPYAVVACHDGRVGVDVERIAPCDERFAELVCTPDERSAVPPAPERDAWLTALWSGKEALAKALGDALSYEPARLASPLLWPDGEAPPWRARPLAVPEGHVGWVVWSEPAGD